LRALKADDEEVYMKLIDTAKDTRITHLLRQTDAYLDSLAQAVVAQQNEGSPAMEMSFESHGHHGRLLKMMGWAYLRSDGGTKTEEHASFVQLFNAKDSEYKVFILSMRAGGLGLNLQTADTVIM
jgi:hypothetical protein